MEMTSKSTDVEVKGSNPLHVNKQTVDKDEISRGVDTELIQWIKRNKATTSLNPRHHDKTFIDESGVRRYEDNWLPAETSAEYNRHHRTGCVEKSIAFLYAHNDAKAQDSEIRFLVDWKSLWAYLEEDNVDEIGNQIPLFRVFVEFYFHKRTAIFITSLLVYIIIALATLNHIYPIMPTKVIAVQMFYYVFEVAIYFAMRVLFKGSLFGDTLKREASRGEDEHSNNHEHESSSDVYVYSLHWTSTLAQLVRTSVHEVKVLAQWAVRHRSGPGTKKSLTFYELMNVSLKFLIRLNGVNVRRVNFNRPTYRLCLLFIVFIFPLYVYFGVYMPEPKYELICPEPWYSDEATVFCKWYTWDLILSGYCTVTAALNYFFASSVLIGLVSLAYGCEIAFRMTHAWINRFKSLHRVELPDSMVEPADESDEKSPLIHHANSKRHISESIQMCNDFESTKITKPPSPQAGAATTTAKQHRMSSAAQMVAAAVHLERTAASREEQLEAMVPLIEIDAREHYMFMREYMSQAGKVWSLGLLGIVCVFLFVTIVSIFFLASTDYVVVSRMATGIAVKFVICVIYPVISISHANSFVFELQDIFKISAEGDFAILGGSEKWIQLLTIAPAVWSIFGFWLTYEKLFAFVWAILSTAAAVGIAILTSRL